MNRFLWCVAILSVAGCTAKPEWGAPVSGTVTFDGKPLSSGAVTFIGATGQARNAEIVDGKYEIAHPPFGDCTITVMTAPEVDETGKAKSGGKYVELPARYGDSKTSDLTCTVTNQPQTRNLTLTR